MSNKKDVRETQGDVEAKTFTDDEKVREGDKDPAVPQVTQTQEQRLKDDAEKPAASRPTGKLVHSDEQEVPARNDPQKAASTDVLFDPTAAGIDRDQSLGFTDTTPLEEDAAQSQARHVPDAPHREPSTYTPSGARPGQQNPVNPQGSPGADPLDPAVGSRPDELNISVEEGRDGSYTKVITEGEKNASQRTYEIDNQPTTHNDY